MKKINLLAVVIVLISMLFCSCENSSNSKGFRGYYFTDSYEGWEGYQFMSALYFTDKSHVVYYEYVANGPYWDGSEVFWSVSFAGKPGWYVQNDVSQELTYVVEDGVIYATNGWYSYQWKVLSKSQIKKNNYETFRKQ